MKNMILGASLFGAIALSGCGAIGNQLTSVSGGLYTDVKSPGAPYSDAGNATKVSSEHCASSYLGLVAMGDASVESAKAQAGITKVAYVDQRNTSVLSSSYRKVCTQVSGE